MKRIGKKTGKDFSSYEQLYDWSVNHIEDFWKSIWELSGIVHSKSYEKVLSENKMPGAKWFEGAQLNFAENLLKFRDDNIAIISLRENYPTIKITYKQLYELTARCAQGLKSIGIKKGDRVAAFTTNIPEAIIGMLAATSIGAIWSSCSPDFGLQGVLDRFGQIQPKVLFAVKSYYYGGKRIDCSEKIMHFVENLPDTEKVILLDEYFDFKGSNITNDIIRGKSLYFSELIDNSSQQIEFEQLDFDHPVYVMYSSGTTGKPKCIVHGAGGTLLQHFKEHYLHTDLKRDDVIFYFTTCGWMMWNWLVSSLQVGARVFLYDGNPSHPDIRVLWKNTELERISIFGTSPKYLSFCQKAGISPKDEFDLSSLRIILSTGSPLSVENFEYVYRYIKADVQLSSISGGTDIISCFILGNPILPVYAGEIQCRGLGMRVEAYNETGKPIIKQKGELVCTAPFPSMPVYFWNEKDGSKYRSAYFDHFPGIWRHGDYIEITREGGIIVHGRSDATLNPGGVRIGTAEIYRIVERVEGITDSLVVGQKWGNDVRVVLFVVLRDGVILDKGLTDKIKNNIRTSATPRHVPAKIIQVKEIPYTISGKKVELAVTKILNGENVDNKDALANPHALEQFYTLPELND